MASEQPSMTSRGVQVARSRKRNSYYELWKARREFDRSQVDRRTRVGRIALEAMSRRGRKSAEEQSALAAVGYPGY
jgi:hypothetical protein